MNLNSSNLISLNGEMKRRKWKLRMEEVPSEKIISNQDCSYEIMMIGSLISIVYLLYIFVLPGVPSRSEPNLGDLLLLLQHLNERMMNRLCFQDPIEFQCYRHA